MPAPLSDNAVHDRLTAAREALGDDAGSTVRGQTALAAARQALDMLALGLIVAGEKGTDTVEVVIPRASGV